VVEQGALSFPPPDDATAGRALVDAVVEGEGLRLSAVVDTEAGAPSTLEPLLALFRGPRPEARSALMLLGGSGRYVALIISGGGGKPELEWNLGPDKQGHMQAPLPTTTKAQLLTLHLDPLTRELVAIVGEGRDARVLGEALHLGTDWLVDDAGERLRAGLGCLDGACTFHALVLEGRALTTSLSPPPLPEPAVVPDGVVVAPEKPLAKKPPPPPPAKPAAVKPTAVAQTKPTAPVKPQPPAKPPAKPVGPTKKK
jgi:hypothetical protein